MGDLTFMVPPQNSILDNNRLIADIAEFLASSDRGFELSDFPYFFDGAADIVLGRRRCWSWVLACGGRSRSFRSTPRSRIVNRQETT